MVSNLCETVDYAEVQGVLFPKVAVSLPSPSLRWRASLFVASIRQDADFKRENKHFAMLSYNGEDAGSGTSESGTIGLVASPCLIAHFCRLASPRSSCPCCPKYEQEYVFPRNSYALFFVR
jgi:hypothetical protein